MDRLRKLRATDYGVVGSYWAYYGKPLDPKALYPDQTSYVFERDGRVLYALALHKIQGLPGGYVEGFVRDPLREADEEAIKALFSYMESEAWLEGCSSLVGTAENAYLAGRYKKLGYNKEMGLYHVLVKEIR